RASATAVSGEPVEGGVYPAGRGETDRVGPAAAMVNRAVGDLKCLDLRGFQRAGADAGVALDGSQPPIGEPGTHLGQIDGRQRIEERRNQALAESERQAGGP